MAGAAAEQALFNAGAAEAATIGLALVIVVLKIVLRWYRKITPIMRVDRCTIDLLNGGVVFPFLMMIGAVFSTPVFEYLKAASPGTTALAGGVGLFFVLGELSRLE